MRFISLSLLFLSLHVELHAGVEDSTPLYNLNLENCQTIINDPISQSLSSGARIRLTYLRTLGGLDTITPNSGPDPEGQPLPAPSVRHELVLRESDLRVQLTPMSLGAASTIVMFPYLPEALQRNVLARIEVRSTDVSQSALDQCSRNFHFQPLLGGVNTGNGIDANLVGSTQPNLPVEVPAPPVAQADNSQVKCGFVSEQTSTRVTGPILIALVLAILALGIYRRFLSKEMSGKA